MERWSSNTGFLLASVGAAVGIGNISPSKGSVGPSLPSPGPNAVAPRGALRSLLSPLPRAPAHLPDQHWRSSEEARHRHLDPAFSSSRARRSKYRSVNAHPT